MKHFLLQESRGVCVEYEVEVLQILSPEEVKSARNFETGGNCFIQEIFFHISSLTLYIVICCTIKKIVEFSSQFFLKSVSVWDQLTKFELSYRL